MSSLILSAQHWVQARLQGVGQWLASMLGDDTQGRKSTISVLDGVRALAFLSVLTYHINRVTGDNLWNVPANPLASSLSTFGASGVVLFFVLSGFLLFMPYAKALLFDGTWPSARAFYIRRVLRIIPAYYVALFLLIIFSHPEYLQRDHLKDLLLFLTFFMDSSPRTFQQINGPFWTLGVEWQFYMLLPLLMLGLYLIVRRVPLQRRLPVLICCLLGLMTWGVFIRYWGFYLAQYPSQMFLIPRRVLDIVMFFLFGVRGKYLEVFAVGMLISLCYIYAKQAAPDSKFVTRAQRLSLWLWGGGILVLVFASMWHFNYDHFGLRGQPIGYHGWPFLNFLEPHYFWLDDFCSSIGYGACVAAILFGPIELKRPFEWRYLRWIGLISYSLYMYHLPMLLFLRDHVLPLLHGLGRYSTYSLYWAWALLIIFPFAFLSFVLTEKPWMKLGDELRRKIEGQKRVGVPEKPKQDAVGDPPKEEPAKVS